MQRLVNNNDYNRTLWQKKRNVFHVQKTEHLHSNSLESRARSFNIRWLSWKEPKKRNALDKSNKRLYFLVEVPKLPTCCTISRDSDFEYVIPNVVQLCSICKFKYFINLFILMIKRIQDTVNRIYATYLDVNIRIIVYFVTLVMKNSSLQPACSKIKLNVIQK